VAGEGRVLALFEQVEHRLDHGEAAPVASRPASVHGDLGG
jgi:hypothetical protein